MKLLLCQFLFLPYWTHSWMLQLKTQPPQHYSKLDKSRSLSCRYAPSNECRCGKRQMSSFLAARSINEADAEDQEPEETSEIIQRTNANVATISSSTPETLRPTATNSSILSNIIPHQILFPEDIAYFYLRNTLGLSEEILWKITLDAPSVLGMTPLTLDRKVSLLRRTMNLSEEDVRIILGKQPALLHYSADRNLAPTILFLVRALDLSKGELREMILDCPSILGYSMDNLKSKLGFFFDTLGYNVDETRNLLVSTPKLLSCAVETGLMPRMKFLHKELQFTMPQLRTLYSKNPRLLLYSLDDNLREKLVFFFILQLNMEPKHVQKLLLSYPQVMDYNLNRHMKPITQYLKSELRFSTLELRSIILKFPRLFTHSLFKIKHVIGYLRYELGLDARQVKRVVFQAPMVFGFGTEGSLRNKVEFLRRRLKLTEEELALVLSKMPTLLCLSVQENLMPKMEYLENALSGDGEDGDTAVTLKNVILKQPALLGYSFEKRIQPRMNQIIEAGITKDKISVGIAMSGAKFRNWLQSSQEKMRQKNMNSSDILLESDLVNSMQHILDLNEKETRALVSKVPMLYRYRAERIILPKIDYLKTAFHNSTDRARTLLLESPHILGCSLEKEIIPRFQKIKLSEEALSNPKLVSRLFDMPTDEFSQWWIPICSSYLNATLFLSKEEENQLFPQIQEVARSQNNAKDLVDFLFTLGDGDANRVKEVILDQPELLLSSPRKLKDMTNHRKEAVEKTEKKYPESREKFRSVDSLMLAALTEKEFSQLLYHIPTKNILLEVLGLPENQIEFILSSSKTLCLSDPDDFLRPKLIYLLEECRMSKEEVSSCLRDNPRLFDYSLEEKIIPRMLFLQENEVSPNMISSAVKLTDKEILYRRELQTYLNLTDGELDLLVPIKTWLEKRHFRINIQPVVHYLAGHLNSSLAKILLEEPTMLHLSLKNCIQPRMELLLKLGHPPKEISSIATMSPNELDQFRLKEYLCSKFHFSKSDADDLFAGVLSQRHSVDLVQKKVEYLLFHVFDGSEVEMRKAVLGEPSLLTLSMKERIIPRVEVLQELKSAGFMYHPKDIANFLTMSNSHLVKELSPGIKNWYPTIHKETSDGEMEEDHDYAIVGKDLCDEVKLILPQTEWLSSDEIVREDARVVHWM